MTDIPHLRERNPVVLGKGDTGPGSRRFPILLERKIDSAGVVLAAADNPAMNRFFNAAGFRNNIELFSGEP